VLTNVGYLYGKLGEFEKAQGYFTDALRIWRAIGHKRGEAIALRHFSIALRDQGRLADARTQIEAAISLLEIMRDHAGPPEQQESLVASLFDFYEIYIDVLMRLHAADPKAGHDLTALAFSEKVKQRSLKDLLTAGWVELDAGANGDLVARERDTNERITASLDKLTTLLQGNFTEAQKAVAEKDLASLQAERRQIQAELRRLSPRYSALTEPEPMAVGEIQRQLLDSSTILLEYALGSDRSYLWAITRDGIQSFKLVPKAEIEAQTRRVYQLLTARQPDRELTAAQQRTREAEADRQFPIEAARLSKLLLGPIAPQLGTKRLLIVADGALQYLPFAALPSPTVEPGSQPKALIVDHDIVSLPSASVLAVLRTEFAGRTPAPKSIAVLADPVYQPFDSRVKTRSNPNLRTTVPAPVAQSGATPPPPSTLPVKATRGGLELSRLLFSRDEAEAIMATTPDRSGLLALDFRANRRLAMSDELSQYRILHFSSHGLLDSRRPELSGLVLSTVDEKGQPQEGRLRLHEIYDLRLNADLVVLSACQTALGRDVRGEGLIGLTRGFMYAGVPRVVASLWEVDDAATTELMKRFYRGLMQQKLPAAAALRAAQLEMLQKKHWQSPYYWGAFVLQGEWK
jgi:CHAT domain-containing protein